MRIPLLALAALLLVATPATAGDARHGGVSTPHRLVGPHRGVVAVPRIPYTASTVPARPFTWGLPSSVTQPTVIMPHARDLHGHGHRPVVIVAPPVQQQQVVIQQYYPVTAYVEPRVCQTPGYWAYRQVPYTTTLTQWVDGHWGPDGTWVDSHYELRPYSSFYNEPYWVPGDPYPC